MYITLILRCRNKVSNFMLFLVIWLNFQLVSVVLKLKHIRCWNRVDLHWATTIIIWFYLMCFIGIQCLSSNTLPRNTFHGINKIILDITLFFRQIPRSVTKILKWNLSFIRVDKYYFATFHENYACDRYF